MCCFERHSLSLIVAADNNDRKPTIEWLAGALAECELDLLQLLMAGCPNLLMLMDDVVGRLSPAVRDNRV